MKLDKCPLCGNKFFLQSKQAFHNLTEETARVVNYNQCVGCGFVFQNPRMSDEELDKFYTTDQYRNLVTMDQSIIDADEENRANYHLEKINSLGIKFNSVLDIGCGRGTLLQKITDKHGYQADGVEPQKGYPLYHGTIYSRLGDVPLKPKYDLIVMSHVLEHVSSPVDFLAISKDVMKDDGHILIEVPSEQSPGGPYRLPHLSVFHTWTLIRLCSTVGLEIKFLELNPHILVIATKRNDGTRKDND